LSCCLFWTFEEKREERVRHATIPEATSCFDSIRPLRWIPSRVGHIRGYASVERESIANKVGDTSSTIPTTGFAKRKSGRLYTRSRLTWYWWKILELTTTIRWFWCSIVCLRLRSINLVQSSSKGGDDPYQKRFLRLMRRILHSLTFGTLWACLHSSSRIRVHLVLRILDCIWRLFQPDSLHSLSGSRSFRASHWSRKIGSSSSSIAISWLRSLEGSKYSPLPKCNNIISRDYRLD
jgi:hypothetical protein